MTASEPPDQLITNNQWDAIAVRLVEQVARELTDQLRSAREPRVKALKIILHDDIEPAATDRTRLECGLGALTLRCTIPERSGAEPGMIAIALFIRDEQKPRTRWEIALRASEGRRGQLSIGRCVPRSNRVIPLAHTDQAFARVTKNQRTIGAQPLSSDIAEAMMRLLEPPRSPS
jgi:hypothetical protein